ncbi:MAG: DNA primase noncatalytic subunit PriX [Nitrososphaeraceae archaeon]|nr:DNA primase noncatalytic subunit PriX [Nitrososphaeraceae archaeon]
MNFKTSYSLEYSSANNTIVEKQVEKGLEFILSHLNKPYWPRTISTKLTEGRQFTVHSRLEALSYFKDSNYLDCRISAYNEGNEIVDFIMIDIDRSKFKSKQELNKAKTRTISKISTAFRIRNKSIKPTTVIWSGNGYHLYIPADSQGNILERMSKFKKSKEPSKEFLRFAEWYLSNGKCDSGHNKTMSFNNCMLRIPASFNSKNNMQVRIIQKWNSTYKVPAYLLYDKFFTYLVNRGPNNNSNSSQLNILQRFYQLRAKSKKGYFIPWIENLLRTPISDHRKYCIWRILAPYLINVKCLSFDEAFDIIDKWLNECDDLEPLDFDTEPKINDCLTNAVDRGYLPISLDNPEKEPKTLKTENGELYSILVTKK